MLWGGVSKTATVVAGAGGVNTWSVNYSGAEVPPDTANAPVTAQVRNAAGVLSETASRPVAVSTSESAVDTTVAGTFGAGPAMVGNQLKVTIYDAFGHKLGQAMVDGNSTFSVNIGQHTGAVFVQITDTDASAPDYWDEATQLPLSLGADFLAYGTVSAGAQTIHVNPITTIAAKVAGVRSAGGVLTIASGFNPADAANANVTVAKYFGLSGDVTQWPLTPVMDNQGHVNANASVLGKVLAALSGHDILVGGVQSSLDGLSADMGNGVSVLTVQSQLLAGAMLVAHKMGLTTLVNDITALMSASTATAGYGVGAIASDGVLSSSEVLTSLTFAVPSSVAAADLAVWLPGGTVKGDGTWLISNGIATYTLGANDLAAMSSLSDGVHSIALKVNASGISTTSLAERLLWVNRADDAPQAVSLLNTLNSISGNTNISAGKKVGDIVVVDVDGYLGGTPVVSNATDFEVRVTASGGYELWLVPRQNPFSSGGSAHALTTTVTAGGVTSSVFTLAVTDMNTPPTITAGPASATLVEAGGVANATAGTASATIQFTKADVDGTASYDTSYLSSNSWSTADSGVTYTKAGTYGTATLTVATGVVSYALNNAGTATQALTAGQSVSDSLSLIHISEPTRH